MPRYPSVPAVRIGRLAVEVSKQGKHIGSLLVLDAMRRALKNELAWAVFLVDAKNERAAIFYEKFLFKRFLDNSLALWLLRRNVEEIF
ncbi:MAG: GNAT family N-acetyltransferase [Desulfovibrio sp.]|nr:GNAT family N-acetyltransferase [Desulfovibrio sp.]